VETLTSGPPAPPVVPPFCVAKPVMPSIVAADTDMQTVAKTVKTAKIIPKILFFNLYPSSSIYSAAILVFI
jgi:hypothetical protein